jgi:hypothetical protein
VPDAQAQGKSAFEVKVHISNDSNNCAWVTIYSSRPGLGWGIERALWFRAGENGTYKTAFPNIGIIQLPAEIKVRAEYVKTRDCHGGVVGDREAVKKGIFPHGSDYSVEVSASIDQSGVRFSY